VNNISILGATGSIGLQTLDIIEREKDKFNLIGVSVNKNFHKTLEIIHKFNPEYLAVMDDENRLKIEDYCKSQGINIRILGGMDGLVKIASIDCVDTVVTSVVGMIGLVPTLSAISHGKNIALANKETLVVAGELVTKLAKEKGVNILPVDSEHCAIFQCLQGNTPESVSKLILTASGGPFRGKSIDELSKVTVNEALRHPNWSMGKKITIDSATLMNKGLEVIEAHWLFNIDYENIEVVVHPESIIHSMVEYCDGSIIAQMGSPDMRLPIQYALKYPERGKRVVERLKFSSIKSLTFEEPDINTFKCLKLAYEAGKIGKLMPTITNAANEVCVDLFLRNKIRFTEIGEIIEECMMKFDYSKEVTIDNIIELDKAVRYYIKSEYK
jgi:1-deoxy-D-xylulose-5-phosphate reductoisomerase